MNLSAIQNRILTSLIFFILLILMFQSLFISTYFLIIFGILSIIEFIKSQKIFKKNFENFYKYIFYNLHNSVLLFILLFIL